MKKRIFKLLLVVLALSLFATTLLAACQHSEVYYLSKGSDFTVYQKESDVPENVRLTKGENNVYTYEADFAQGDQFVVYNVGSDVNVVTSVFSSEQHLTLADGKVSVADAGHYALSLDVAKGELTYVYTAPAPSAPTVQSVQLTAKVGTLKVGETSKFVAKVTMSDTTTNGNVTWQSTNQQVATVDADGTVHALAEGTTVISATAGGVSDSVQLTVTQATTPTVPVTAIELSGEDLTDGELYLYVGDSATVNVTVAPANATNKAYSYQLRGEEGVVQVSALPNGGGYTVTTLKEGEVTLVVTSDENDQIKAECTIYVDPVAVTDLTLDPSQIGGTTEFYVDDVQNITVTVSPANATHKEYSYSLDKEDVVRVEEVEGGYKITALAVGTVKLTVTSDDNEEVTRDCQIVVSAKVVKSIELEKEITVEVGEQYQLTATLKPDGAVDTVTWSVLPEGIVSVDESSGNVTALAPGEATVTAQSGNGVTAQCKVIVPTHLTAMSIPSSLTIYTGDGAQPRDIEVSVTPTNATYKDFTVEVEQDGDVISYEKGDGKVTVTGLTVGTATLTVTSTDKTEISASCTITVKDISEAVPYVSKSSVKMDIGSSETIQVYSDAGEITGIEFDRTSSAVGATAEKVDGVWNVTITGNKFCYTNIKVKPTVGEVTTEIDVWVKVAPDYFYLTGDWDGDGSGWETQSSEDDARSANLLLEQTEDHVYIYEITRDIEAGAKFYILPANIDTNWDNALKTAYYKALSNAEGLGVTVPDNQNVQVAYTGNYTIKLTLDASECRWNVTVNYLAPEDVKITATEPSLVYDPENNPETNLSFVITPTLVANSISEKNIVWSVVEEQYKDWIELTPRSESTSILYTAKLVKFEGEEEVKITISATITAGNFVKTATIELTAMPQGSAAKPVTEINFSEEGPVYVNVSSGWTHTLKATVNEDATVQDVTYSIVSTPNFNGDSTQKCFTINSTSGVLTAIQFGRVTVKATSVGDDADGRKVSATIDVVFYSTTLKLSGSFYGHSNSDWKQNLLNYTTKNSNTSYTWTGVELHKNDQLVVLYSSSEWSKGIMRTFQHLKSSPIGALTAETSGDTSFKVVTAGIYDIVVNLDLATPTVTFTKTGDIEVADTWSYTASIYMNYVNTYTTDIKTLTNVTVSNESPTVKFVYDFSHSKIATNSGQKFNWKIVANGSEKWYSDNANKITYSGTGVSSAYGSATTWYYYNGQIESKQAIKNTTWTFTFTFDADGNVTKCLIESGDTSAAAASVQQPQSAIVGVNNVVLSDLKRQVAVMNAVPVVKF